MLSWLEVTVVDPAFRDLESVVGPRLLHASVVPGPAAATQLPGPQFRSQLAFFSLNLQNSKGLIDDYSCSPENALEARS